MPEGHTIHRLARDQAKTLVGQALQVSSPQGRFADGADVINGLELQSIEACGKHLFYNFAPKKSGPVLHVHLGLFGKYRTHAIEEDESPPPPRGAVRVRFLSATHVVDLNGPNQCEIIDPAERDDIIESLGPDPLRDDAKPERAWSRIHRSRAPIGQLIMDQSVIAGIGNIYRSEILFRQKLRPDLPGHALTKRQFNALWKDAVKLLNIGVKYNRIITVDLETLKSPSRARRSELMHIFNKPTCSTCRGPVTRFEINNRRAFRCERCQVK